MILVTKVRGAHEETLLENPGVPPRVERAFRRMLAKMADPVGLACCDLGLHTWRVDLEWLGMVPMPLLRCAKEWCEAVSFFRTTKGKGWVPDA